MSCSKPPRRRANGKEGAAAYNAKNGWRERLFNTRYACPACKTGVAEVEPRTFSFNSPYGACPGCDGMGENEGFDPELVLPDLSLSLKGGAVAPWRTATAAGKKKRFGLVEPLLETLKVDQDTPLDAWPRGGVQKLLTGDSNGFPGTLALLEQELLATKREATRDRLADYRGVVTCADCDGTRLRPEGRSCRIAGKPIHEVSALSITAARKWFAGLIEQEAFAEDRLPIAEPLVREISRRLEFLDRAGVGYLTLDRAANTLSGGELQRVRLATGIGSGLVGVMYLLDEPSIGLHPSDNDRLISVLRELQQQGNTVIVVEHDEALMRSADWLIDVGPGAGPIGGEIVSQGAPDEVANDQDSVTGHYLSGTTRIETPAKRRVKAKASKDAIAPCPTPKLSLRGATLNNLRGDDFHLPLGTLPGEGPGQDA